MKLICPSCGAVASADAWSSDADARQCIRIISELPGEVARRSLPYLALFRPAGGRGLRWSSALRLLSELQALVKGPYIQWESKVARPNAAAAWSQAMERVIAVPPKRLPLKSHGYLRAIAYEIADELDRASEKSRTEKERAGKYQRSEVGDQESEGLTVEEMKAIADRNFRSRLRKEGSTT